MSTKHDDGDAVNTDDLKPSGPGPEARESDLTRRESAVTDDEAAVLSREKLATDREDVAHLRETAADLREDAAHQREGTVSLREDAAYLREGSALLLHQDLRASEAIHATSTEQVLTLQQVTTHLAAATQEARKLSEQVAAANTQMEYLVHHDALTDLPNRVLLQDRLSQAIELARRRGGRLAVLFLGLDRFKHINDALGHAIGDAVLLSVAQRLTDCVRQSDTISRQGGDEFVVLLPSIEHEEDAALSAQKILEAIMLPHRVEHNDLHITGSIGISVYPDDGQDSEALIRNVDAAMYYAKESGRNSYKFFEPGMNARAVQRQSIEASLRLALERQEFVLHYQPKIDLQSGSITGVEALIRWQHPELGLVAPAQFIAIAEDCGLILPIGRWVLREACRQARAWLEAGLPPITVAVNTSALEFRAQDFFENVRATLADTPLEARFLELELTESVLMRDAEATDTMLRALADLGVKLAIDDFGTGYSSLSYLRQFPVNTLKIDQSFVKQMTSNANDATLISTVISMGKNLKQRVIAEGVETPEQYAFLLAQECDEGQGYFFSRPVAAATLASLLQGNTAAT